MFRNFRRRMTRHVSAAYLNVIINAITITILPDDDGVGTRRNVRVSNNSQVSTQYIFY